jgi:carbon monoxide dehydrogenase subunit G
MDMTGSRQLAISQQQAWDALNDPQVLKTCIPGCEKVEQTGDNQYAMAMAVKIGPVSARFNGKIALADVNPPASYTINFEGQGGAAGFGKGNAKVALAPADGGGCELTYSAHAQVGGKIAQVGQRLVDGVAKSMAEDFFKRFDDEMQRQHPQAYEAAAAAAAASAATPASAETQSGPDSAAAGGGVPAWAWAVGAAVVAIAAWWLLR